MKFSPNLKSRLCIGTGSLLVLAFLIGLSQIKGFGWIFVAALSGTVSVALLEYTSICKIKEVNLSFRLLAISTTIFFFARYLAFVVPILYFLPALIFFLIATLFVLSSMTEPQGSLSRLAHTVFGFCYISLPLSWTIEIHGISPFWFIWLIAVVKGGDIAAYVTGKTVGKHLLAPSLSPKKTIEGALATILGSALISLLFAHFSPSPLALKQFFSLGSAIGGLAILGDLSESLIKRDANVKDSSTIPGLGGVLDILDSLLFTTPCLYFYLKLSHLLVQ
jgi:phosphatidate cytidylyltransferase